MTIDECLKWREEKPDTRCVEVRTSPRVFTIWLWDEKAQAGQFAHDVNEVTFYQKVDERDKAEFERLKKKFEANPTDDAMDKIMEDKDCA